MRSNKSFFPIIFVVMGTCVIFLNSCSPIKSLPQEEKHQMELTLHEVQTNLDDSRHEIHCFKMEMEILEGKIFHLENSIASMKHSEIEKQTVKLEKLSADLQVLHKKFSDEDQQLKNSINNIQKLSKHANETTDALGQYKTRINDLEKNVNVHSRHLEEITSLKTTVESVAKAIREITNDSALNDKLYVVQPNDTLGEIAKMYSTNVEKLKQINNLKSDRIVVGQKLKVSQ